MTRVLIVDDHPSFRASARAMLEDEGFEVVGEAADGRSALAAARELEPDLVLLDVQLPDVSGFEVSELIDGSTQVVLVSSRDESEYQGLLDASPARGFITKSELSGPAIRELLA